MSDINDVILIGYITKPIELRKTPVGQSVTTIDVVTCRRKNVDGEEKNNITHHTVVLWRKQAEYAATHFKKGTQVCIIGRLQTRKWESKDGVTKIRTEIIADNISLAESVRDGVKPNINNFISSVNSVRIYGNIVKEFEVRKTPAGNKVTNLIVATKFVRINKDGKKEDRPEYNNIVVWDDLAELAQQYLTKGSKVFIEGAVVNRVWESPEGYKKVATEVIAEKLIPTSIAPNARIKEVLDRETNNKPNSNEDDFTILNNDDLMI